MQQDKAIEVEGRITNVLPGTMFHVELANKHTVLAHISGKMRKRFIRLLNGDRVKLEMSPYDLSKARSCTVSARADLNKVVAELKIDRVPEDEGTFDGFAGTYPESIRARG